MERTATLDACRSDRVPRGSGMSDGKGSEALGSRGLVAASTRSRGSSLRAPPYPMRARRRSFAEMPRGRCGVTKSLPVDATIQGSSIGYGAASSPFDFFMGNKFIITFQYLGAGPEEPSSGPGTDCRVHTGLRRRYSPNPSYRRFPFPRSLLRASAPDPARCSRSSVQDPRSRPA